VTPAELVDVEPRAAAMVLTPAQRKSLIGLIGSWGRKPRHASAYVTLDYEHGVLLVERKSDRASDERKWAIDANGVCTALNHGRRA